MLSFVGSGPPACVLLLFEYQTDLEKFTGLLFEPGVSRFGGVKTFEGFGPRVLGFGGDQDPKP